MALSKSPDSWSDEKFAHLREQSLKSQLGAIFGDTQAEQYLNPSMRMRERERKRMKTIPSNMSTNKIGASELWDSLRSQSKQKQSKLDCPSESRLSCTRSPVTAQSLKKVATHTHKLQFMYKVAQINEVRAKRLIKKIDLPHMTGNWDVDDVEDDERIAVGDEKCIKTERIDAKYSGTDKNDVQCSETSTNDMKCTETYRNDEKCASRSKTVSFPEINTAATLPPKQEVIIDSQTKVLSFLSNEDTACDGQFRERMVKSRGVNASVGIANASHSYQYNSRKCNSKPQQPVFREPRRTNVRGNNQKRVNSWEPLTISAMVECLNNLSTRTQGVCQA